MSQSPAPPASAYMPACWSWGPDLTQGVSSVAVVISAAAPVAPTVVQRCRQDITPTGTCTQSPRITTSLNLNSETPAMVPPGVPPQQWGK